MLQVPDMATPESLGERGKQQRGDLQYVPRVIPRVAGLIGNVPGQDGGIITVK